MEIKNDLAAHTSLIELNDEHGNHVKLVLEKDENYINRHELFLVINEKKLSAGKFSRKKDVNMFLDYMKMVIKSPAPTIAEFDMKCYIPAAAAAETNCIGEN